MNAHVNSNSHGSSSSRNICSNTLDKAKRSLTRRPPTAQQPSPLTPPITSPNSRASVSSSDHYTTNRHDMVRLPSLGGFVDSLKSHTANGSANTCWGVSRYRLEDYEGEIYSHDMASQYFALAHIPDHQVNARGQPVSDQRIMSRVKSQYPLPCDAQEQQVSSYRSSYRFTQRC